MSPKTETRLTPRQRLNRGLTYTAVGPVDITRGVVGLGAHSARAGAASLRRRYQEGQLAEQLAEQLAVAPETVAKELAAAQEVVSGLPQALHDARQSQRRRRRPWVIAASAAVIVGGGAVAFSLSRRSSRAQEPSPLPPSVEVQPRP
jgi:hypothetical protein